MNLRYFLVFIFSDNIISNFQVTSLQWILLCCFIYPIHYIFYIHFIINYQIFISASLDYVAGQHIVLIHNLYIIYLFIYSVFATPEMNLSFIELCKPSEHISI